MKARLLFFFLTIYSFSFQWGLEEMFILNFGQLEEQLAEQKLF